MLVVFVTIPRSMQDTGYRYDWMILYDFRTDMATTSPAKLTLLYIVRTGALALALALPGYSHTHSTDPLYFGLIIFTSTQI